MVLNVWLVATHKKNITQIGDPYSTIIQVLATIRATGLNNMISAVYCFFIHFSSFQDLKNLPPRDYCSTRDPFVRISVLKDRRSLRKRSKQVLAEFNTRTVRHQLNPIFEQTFTAELPISDIKVCFLFFIWVLWIVW